MVAWPCERGGNRFFSREGSAERNARAQEPKRKEERGSAEREVTRDAEEKKRLRPGDRRERAKGLGIEKRRAFRARNALKGKRGRRLVYFQGPKDSLTPTFPAPFNARVAPSAPLPADDAFARRLWRPGFVRQVRIASKPMIPMILRSEHDDLVQEALVRAYNARETFKGEGDQDLLKWVLVIVRNYSRDVADKRSKEPDFEPLPIDSPDLKVSDPAKVAEAREGSEEKEARLPAPIAKWLLTAKGVLRCLSPDDQEILKLRLGLNLSINETARMLGISEGTVKMRYRRAFERVIELAKNAGLAAGEPQPGGPHLLPPAASEGDEEE